MRECESKRLLALADRWINGALQRDKVTPGDPAAQAMRFAAAELRDVIRAILDEPQDMTTEEYAREHAVTPQTVRIWCRSGQIPATPTPHGWRISPEARPPSLRRSA